jgi:hypothetical protein
MTNGEKLLSVFEGAQIYGVDKEECIIKVCVDNFRFQFFDLDWWNREYTDSEEEND